MLVIKYVLHCNLGHIEFRTEEERTAFIAEHGVTGYTLSEFEDDIITKAQALITSYNLIDNKINAGQSTIDWDLCDYQKITLTGKTTRIEFLQPSKCGELFLIVRQDEIGNREIIWPDWVKYQNGETPSIGTYPEAVSMVKFFYDGYNYYLRNIETNYK